MNKYINYSGFVEMVLESSDDHEPYGCSDDSVYDEESISCSKMYTPENQELHF